LACRGDVEEAKRLLERVLSHGNDLGLFAEEIDPETGAALGNFPQAFTHVGLIHRKLSSRVASRKRMQRENVQ
jgi:GH15 family glucan-1,4-alpha-glucosidase